MFEKRLPFLSGHRTGPKITIFNYLSQSGDYLYLPVPAAVDEGLETRNKSNHQAGSALTPISAFAIRPHWAVVKSVSEPFTIPSQTRQLYSLTAYIVRSFAGNVLQYVKQPASKKPYYIPVPPIVPIFPSPPGFSPDLDVGGFSNNRLTWLDAEEVTFVMASNQTLKRLEPHVQLLSSELARIDAHARKLQLEAPPQSEEAVVGGDGVPSRRIINSSHGTVRKHTPPPNSISPRPTSSAPVSLEEYPVAESNESDSTGSISHGSQSGDEEGLLMRLAPKVYEKYIAEQIEAENRVARDRIGDIARWRLEVE
ncbi:hypothetical protein BOTBODRAFT_178625 [Botryobasidium botryosum FD-172 SS1]|uniref:Uncharacterized protein n=1 Tax=Botryobasidium botryosum (strain FD-172 SS1) TaxID=930990 RepID=A0A067MDG0_BOTB1|nr:hypothetical protein BOTBODRAFT_178625 [Botryobasidium botryosum FD-172 SS1]